MKDIYKALLIAVISRAMLFAASTISNYAFTYVNPNYMDVSAIDSFPFIGQFDRWDSEIYINIARNGYSLGYPDVSSFPQLAHAQNIPPLAMPEWAFFPLYPVAMQAGSILFTVFLSPVHSLMLSGFLISNLSFFISVIFFYKLTEKLFKNPKVAILSTVFYSFCGGAIFLSSIFSEALFMALTLGAFFFLEKNKISIAIALGILASLTRSNGFLIAIPFLVAAILSIRADKKRSLVLFASSVVVSSGYLWFNVAGYFAAGGVFPVHVIAHDLNWQAYPPITQQLITLGSQVTPDVGRPNIFQAFYIISLTLMCLPAVYFFIKQKTVISIEHETIKYWAYYGVMLYVIFVVSYLPSTVRYAIPLLPMYWVFAKVAVANRVAAVILLTLTIVLSIVGAYLLEISTPYFL
ncbi:MAG: hypothetical protein GX799_04345 [Crenarchaeota archaeon]|nr:hypothetical protein [Thermoproteota archaeon]